MAKIKQRLSWMLALFAPLFGTSVAAQEDPAPKSAGSDDEASKEASGTLSAGAIAAAVAAAAAIAAAMDDDDLRRGYPTCHIVYGEAQAILAGDALQTLAFELIATHNFNCSAQSQVKMIAALAHASGIEGMVAGQGLDIAATDKVVSVQELERIHKLKTGALINCAITLGALCSEKADEQTLENLSVFGYAIGLAFQVHDDILDVEGDTFILGKPQGSDIEANKATYPALLGMLGAKEKAQNLITQAHEALALIDADTTLLASLANYLIERDH